MNRIEELFIQAGGEFVSPPAVLSERLQSIRAIIFDWDGVFNNGFKSGAEGSPFSEVDAMGTNLMRYCLFRKNSVQPAVAIITGEENPSAWRLAEREHFHAMYPLAKNKPAALEHFCVMHGLRPSEVMFFFDDVLDLEVAARCGVRMMIGRSSAPMLRDMVGRNGWADYITGHDGGAHGLREACELVMALTGKFEEVVSSRMKFDEAYANYLEHRQLIKTVKNSPVS